MPDRPEPLHLTGTGDLRAENAPKSLPTCPNCRNRTKAGGLDGNGGDFWNCTAEPVLPEFAGHQLRFDGRGLAINLRLFDPAHPCSANLNGRRCPLFTPLAEADTPDA